jgi:hypothetical protein
LSINLKNTGVITMAKDESKVTAEDMLAYVVDSLKDLVKELEEFVKPPEEGEEEPSSMSQRQYEKWRRKGGGK